MVVGLDFPSAWKLMAIENCMSTIIDYRGKSPQKTSWGIPLITAKIVKDGRILPPNEYIAPEDYDNWMGRGLPQAGDVVITTEAPLGEVAQLDGRKVALAQRLITLRGKPEVLDNNYLKFALQSQFLQGQIKARGTGTTVIGIRQSELRKVKLPIPPLSEQHAIAHVLGTLDDKTELNRRTNETLEAMARAIFQSWFVDFDAVRAKAEGRPLDGLDATTAALFPDSFEDSSLGKIPHGWSVGTIGDLASNQRIGVDPSQLGPRTPYIGLEHMPRKSIALIEWGQADGVASNKFRFAQGDILFGKLRPYFHKVGVAALDGVCSTDILVIVPKKPHYFALVLTHISSEELVQYADAASTGTKMPRTNWQDLARYEIVIPGDENIMKLFDRSIRPLVQNINANIHESRTLAAIRDALLPKLLSGEVRVKDAERFLEIRM